MSLLKEKNPWLIWGIAALFYLYEMVLRVAPSVMTQELMSSFQMTSTQLGVLISFYYYSYTALQLPCGLILDRLGARRLVTFSSLLCTFGAFLFATTHSIPVAQGARFMIGAGSACAFISCLKLTAGWFTPMQFALVAGLTNMMGGLGGTFAGRPLAMLVNSVGWRPAMVILAVTGVFITVLCWCFICDPKASKQEEPSLRKALFKVCESPQIWIASLIGSLMYLPVSAFSELWGIPFLMSTYNISNEEASIVTLMIFVGMALGSPGAAYLSNLLKSYRRVMTLSALITSTLFVAMAHAHMWSYMATVFVAFLIGFFLGGQVLCFTCSKNSVPLSMSGTSAAFTNTVVMLSGVIFQPFLGYVVDAFWTGKCNSSGLRLYDQTCYRYAILTIPICLAMAFILSFLLKETYKNEKDSKAQN